MSKEKQIEEMAKVAYPGLDRETVFSSIIYAQPLVNLYNAGYRKQSEGCKLCGTTLYIKTIQNTMPLLAPVTRVDELRHELLNLTGEVYVPLEAKYCPFRGKEMKGV